MGASTEQVEQLYDDNGNPILTASKEEQLYDDNGQLIRKRHGATGSWAAAPPPPPPPPPKPKTIGGFVGNIPSSAENLVSGIGQMIAHPVNTIQGMADVVHGGAQKAHEAIGAAPLDPAGTIDTSKVPSFDAFVNAMKERYGGADAIGNTLYHDPIGAAMDVSGLLSGGSSVAASRLPRIAQFLERASEFSNPIRLAGKTAGLAGKVGSLAARATLGATTRAGLEAVNTALEGSKPFQESMRGNIGHYEALDSLKGAVEELVDRRRQKYETQLAQIPQQVQLNTAMTPIQDAMNDALKKFNIGVVNGKGGPELDFSRSALRHLPDEMQKVQAAFGDVNEWGSRPGDLSPLGLDKLKQGLREMVNAKAGRGDAIVQKVHDTVRTLLEDNVPGYKELTSDYASASQFLDDIRSELSVGPNAKEGTGIRKLTSALNQKSSYRRDLIDTIDISTGSNLRQILAGLEFQKGIPHGAFGPLAMGAGGVELFHRLSGLVSTPQALISALAGAATFSPRLVGEILNGLGRFRSTGLPTAAADVVKGAETVLSDPALVRAGAAAGQGGTSTSNSVPPPPPPPPQ